MMNADVDFVLLGRDNLSRSIYQLRADVLSIYGMIFFNFGWFFNIKTETKDLKLFDENRTDLDF
jgi:hypothetical protein